MGHSVPSRRPARCPQPPGQEDTFHKWKNTLARQEPCTQDSASSLWPVPGLSAGPSSWQRACGQACVYGQVVCPWSPGLAVAHSVEMAGLALPRRPLQTTLQPCSRPWGLTLGRLPQPPSRWAEDEWGSLPLLQAGSRVGGTASSRARGSCPAALCCPGHWFQLFRASGLRGNVSPPLPAPRPTPISSWLPWPAPLKPCESPTHGAARSPPGPRPTHQASPPA